jgi:hypothetical protein
MLAPLAPALPALLLAFLLGCQPEQTATPQIAHGTNTGTGSETGTGVVGPSGSFDLCKDGLESGKISGFDDFVSEICGSANMLQAYLTVAANVYKGTGDPPLYKHDTPGSGTLEVHLLSSSLVNATASDYFNLVKLQVSNPQAYKNAGYKYDTATTLANVVPSASQSSFHMEYDNGSGGVVKYDAVSHFIPLANGQAYVSATQGTQYEEMVTGFKGMIIVNQLSGNTSEVFTISDQSYSVQDAQIATTESHAIQGAKDEMNRMYLNAMSASKAGGLLGN